jgi:hypothetical protein
MKSSALGKSISTVEVQDISRHGVWLYANRREYFLPYEDYPWFEKANVLDIYNVELLNHSHLHWPSLDIDLEIESLHDRIKYPLIYK